MPGRKTVPPEEVEPLVASRRRGRPPKHREPIPSVTGIPDGQVVEIALESVDMNDTDLEFRVDRRIKDIVEDIGRNGQQFPVILRSIEGREKYQLVSGFRRCRSLLQLGWPTVKAIVRTDLDNDAAFRVSFLENERRKSLTGVDKAHAVMKLRSLGKSDDEIQSIYGIGPKQYRRYQRVSELPDELKVAITEGRLRTTHAIVILQAWEAHREKMDIGAWITRCEKNDISVRQLVRALNADCGKARAQRRWMERRSDGGFRIYAFSYDPKTTTDSAKQTMVSRLREALELLERQEPGAQEA